MQPPLFVACPTITISDGPAIFAVCPATGLHEETQTTAVFENSDSPAAWTNGIDGSRTTNPKIARTRSSKGVIGLGRKSFFDRIQTILLPLAFSNARR